MKAEEYFFMYAFPCAHIIVERRGMSEEEHEKLKKDFLEGKRLEKERLEKIFTAAFRRIKKLAERMGRDYWDFEVIKEYWDKEHNRLIDNNEDGYEKISESLKDLCRIIVAEVVKKIDNKLIVRYNGEERLVFSDLVPEAKVGDRVRIHYAYAVEKV